MGKIKIMGFYQPPTILFDDPIPKRHHLISHRIHQKMRKGCRNDYLEAFGAVFNGSQLAKMKKGIPDMSLP